jgi:hypothetical protein
MRRLGGSLLLVLWLPIATANALSCVLACEWLQAGHPESHADQGASSHHTGGALTSSEDCWSAQLVVASFLPHDFPSAVLAPPRRGQQAGLSHQP